MCGSSVNAARNPDVPLSAINRPARNYSDGCLSIYPKTGDAPLNCINCIFWASVNHAYRNQLLDGEFAIHENRSPRPRPDTDDVWAWIIIGLVAAGVMLAIWSPTLKAMLQT